MQVAVDPRGHADQGGAWRQGTALRSPPCHPTAAPTTPSDRDPQAPARSLRAGLRPLLPHRAVAEHGPLHSPNLGFHLCEGGAQRSADLTMLPVWPGGGWGRRVESTGIARRARRALSVRARVVLWFATGLAKGGGLCHPLLSCVRLGRGAQIGSEDVLPGLGPPGVGAGGGGGAA